MHHLLKKTFKTAALLSALVLMGAAQAGTMDGLQARDLDGNAANGAEAFYDTVLNITWLRAASTDRMDWSRADAWAKQDRFGLSGWRLPTTVDKGQDGCNWSSTGGTDCGYNPDSSVATGSEMAHLFFQSLGNKSYFVPGTTDQQPGWGLSNTGDFQNLKSYVYWSGTELEPDSDRAWNFRTYEGSQGLGDKAYSLYALAVRPGDVTAAVPELQTWAMLLLGLGGLLFARRQRAL